MSFSAEDYDFILRNDLASFIERSFYELNSQTQLILSPYIEVLASRLEACRQQKLRRLIISMPPRSLKSHCVSVAFPAFLLGHNPAAQIICVSYGQDLADKLARDCRNLMDSGFYQRVFRRTRLSQDKRAANDFMTTEQGFRMSTSVGGVLTGRGADVIIIDDPLKSEDALSETKRELANSWYENTLLSRLNSKQKGIIILVMQRLHQDDLAGHLESQGGWEVLSFPAIAEEDERLEFETIFGSRTFQRKRGEALQPERENLEVLAGLRKSMGEYSFVSQYQQDPIPIGGVMVKSDWLRYYDEVPENFLMKLQSWDTANKSGELNDFSVCTTWGVVNRQYYLLNVYRHRMNYPELKRAVCEQAGRYQPSRILIEDKASGTQLIQDLQHEGQLGVTAYKPPPSTDKLMRLHAQTAEFENGRVFLPRTASWLDEYVRELISFPGSKYDDQVDSTTQALEHLKINNSLLVWQRLGQ
jgi:predicted phage terminase large subunit-like protein